MLRPIVNIIISVVITAGVVAGGYVYLTGKHISFLDLFSSCKVPVEYSIGAFDTRFGISAREFQSAVAEAEGEWEQALGTTLFERVDTGGLVINLVYDRRQQETQELGELGSTIDQKKSLFEQTKARQEGLQVLYNEKIARYKTDLALYNKKGGSRAQYDALEAQRQEINLLADSLNASNRELEALVNDVNSSVNTYNNNGSIVDKEFEEGVYISDASGERINIYQFEDHAKLVSVLAHELGHALGLDHVEDSLSIMFRLNRGNQRVTAENVNGLKALCSKL